MNEQIAREVKQTVAGMLRQGVAPAQVIEEPAAPYGYIEEFVSACPLNNPTPRCAAPAPSFLLPSL
ncbi:MAG TPA: hypothetical protein DDX29_00745 [Clostridiales bacterium]|nr:hypothetical protein [Clostridiales bacterium]